MPQLYRLPTFLEGLVDRAKYIRWLHRKAAAHVKRDRLRLNKKIALAGYKQQIHIAVAFVATIYGVGFANLIFIPIGNKIRKNVLEISRHKHMILDGALLVGTGLNAQLIEQKLISYKSK